MPAISVLLPVSAFIALASIAIILYALRGRRINDHPICRRCRYDLFATPVSNHHPIRRRFLLPLLTFAVGLGILGGNVAKAVDWNLPAWWVVNQAHSPQPAARDSALAKLAGRIKEHSLSPAQEQALIAEALSRQADLQQPWVAGWGVLVESAHRVGRLPDDQWTTYLFQAPQFWIRPTQPAFRACDKLEFEIGQDASRVGKVFDPPDWFEACISAGKTAKFELSGRPAPVTVEQDYALELPLVTKATEEPSNGLVYEFTASDENDRQLSSAHCDKGWNTINLNEGPQTARLTLFLYPEWQDYNHYRKPQEKRAPVPPARRVVQVSCPWILVPSPRVNVDPTLRNDVERSISATGTECARRMMWGDHDSWEISGTLAIRKPPCDLAFRVVFYKPGTDDEYASVYHMFARKGVDTDVPIQTGNWIVPKDYDRPTVNIKLIPAPTVSPVGTAELWGGAIELRDVPVKRGSRREGQGSGTINSKLGGGN